MNHFIQMMLQLSQLPLPLAAIFSVCTENVELDEGTFQAHVLRDFVVVFLAYWAVVFGSFGSLTTCMTEARATTCSLVWVTEE